MHHRLLSLPSFLVTPSLHRPLAGTCELPAVPEEQTFAYGQQFERQQEGTVKELGVETLEGAVREEGSGSSATRQLDSAVRRSDCSKSHQLRRGVHTYNISTDQRFFFSSADTRGAKAIALPYTINKGDASMADAKRQSVAGGKTVAAKGAQSITDLSKAIGGT